MRQGEDSRDSRQENSQSRPRPFSARTVAAMFSLTSLCWLLWIPRKGGTHPPEKELQEEQLDWAAPTDCCSLLDYVSVWILKCLSQRERSCSCETGSLVGTSETPPPNWGARGKDSCRSLHAWNENDMSWEPWLKLWIHPRPQKGTRYTSQVFCQPLHPRP